MDRKSPHASGEYARAIVTLAQHDVEFAICGGGVASVYHEVPRVTADLDLLVRMTDDNLERFGQAVKELGLHPRAPVSINAICDHRQRKEWTEQKQAKVMTFVSPDSPLQIDVLLQYPLDFTTVYNQAFIGELDGESFRVPLPIAVVNKENSHGVRALHGQRS